VSHFTTDLSVYFTSNFIYPAPIFHLLKCNIAGANPTIASYYARAVKIYSATSSHVCFGNKNISFARKNALVYYNADVAVVNSKVAALAPGLRRFRPFVIHVPSFYKIGPNILLTCRPLRRNQTWDSCSFAGTRAGAQDQQSEIKG
jgi:hypothetical protein